MSDSLRHMSRCFPDPRRIHFTPFCLGIGPMGLLERHGGDEGQGSDTRLQR